MNQTNHSVHCAPECLVTGRGTMEPAMKIGITGINLLRYFDKHSNKTDATYYADMRKALDKLYWSINNNQFKDHPIKEIIFGVSTDFFSNLKPQQITDSNCAFKQRKPQQFEATCKYSNRFYPFRESDYENKVYFFLDELAKRVFPGGKSMLDMATFDLWEEPNADRYNFMGDDERLEYFKDFTDLKIYMFKDSGRPLLLGHTTVGLLLPDNSNAKPEYLDYINSFPFDNQIGFSTSLYEVSSGNAIFDYNNNKFPTNLPANCRKVLSECGYATGLVAGSAHDIFFKSKGMMRYFIDVLKFSKKVGADTISWFSLYDCASYTDRGYLAMWEPRNDQSGIYTARPHWYVFMDFMAVVKDGWEATANGVKGANGEEIVLTGTGYTVK